MTGKTVRFENKAKVKKFSNNKYTLSRFEEEKNVKTAPEASQDLRPAQAKPNHFHRTNSTRHEYSKSKTRSALSSADVATIRSGLKTLKEVIRQRHSPP